jgi:hypothetical protein
MGVWQKLGSANAVMDSPAGVGGFASTLLKGACRRRKLSMFFAGRMATGIRPSLIHWRFVQYAIRPWDMD